MNAETLTKLLTVSIENDFPCLIVGKPGIGKTDIANQVAKILKRYLMISHLTTSDPTDAKGFPFPDKNGKIAKFLPFGDLYKAINTKQKTIWFLDDLGQAMPSVQAAYMQLVLGRAIGEHKISDNITFLAATNSRQDKAGVQGILEPLKSRFTILNLETDIDAWVTWALKNNMPSEVIAFIKFRPNLLHDFRPSTDMENSPCPRTWAKVGDFFNVCQDDTLLYEFSRGLVGEGASIEFLSFLKIYKTLPSIDALLLNPDTTPIPTELNSLYAITVGLATRAKQDNFSRIYKIATRLQEMNFSEFAALLIKDSVNHSPECQYTKEFLELPTSPLGKLII